MNESDFLKLSVEQLVEQEAQGLPDQWTDRDFKCLSERVSQKTGIYISKNTLKNIIRKAGKTPKYNPQQATKDALACFLGYQDWDDFKQKQKPVEPLAEKKALGKKQSWWLWVFGAAGFAGLLLLIWWHTDQNKPAAEEDTLKNSPVYDYTFEAHDTVGLAPHTVTFTYDISNLQTDSVFLDHNYEHHRMGYQQVRLDPDKHRINHCYQLPNYYLARLYIDGHILEKKHILVKSDDWIGMVSDRFSQTMENKPALKHPEFKHLVFSLYDVFQQPIVDSGMLYISPDTVAKLDINPRFYWTEFRNIQDFACLGDACTFEVRFRNSAQYGGISCFDSQFILQGDSGYIKLTLVEPGCYRFANAVIGKTLLSGEVDDLSSFQHDLSRWNTLKIKTSPDTVCLYLNDKLFWKQEQTQPLSWLKGMVISFKGSGAIDHVRLSNAQGKAIYDNDFSSQ